MNIFKRLNIKHKLMRMNLISIGVALSLVMVVLGVQEFNNFKQFIVNNLSIQARIIGSNSAAAISFSDRKAAEDILSSFKDVPNIVRAVIYTKEGALFAQYDRDGNNATSSDVPIKYGYSFEGGYFSLFQTITLADEIIGTIYLKSDIKSLYSRLILDVVLLFFIAAVSLIVASSLFSRLQVSITGPISELVYAMQTVSKNKDYALRVPVRGDDELGVLAGGFNEMLEQIQRWDEELSVHRQHLEEEVAKRTFQWKDANAKLQEELVERMKAEERLQRKTDELLDVSVDLKRALEAEKRFLATISHEIRTPLNSVIGFTDILMTMSLEERQQHLLSNANKSAHHLLSLINDVLDVSKIDAEQLELKLGPFDISELLMECIAIVSSHINRDVQILYDIPELSYFVMGDSVRIKQIFLNLLGNSIKFTEKGHVKLSIVKHEDLHPSGIRFTFCVEDTGIGIPQDRIKDLFSPFRQLHSSKYGGTGLGLYLSRSLAYLMSGDIEVESKEGEGTRFYVRLVLEKAPEGFKEKMISRILETDKDRFSHLRVLLVEDVEMNVLVAREMLTRFFNIFSIDVANDGLDAVKKVQDNQYDIVFMDIQMPNMDGITATEEIRKLGINVPIIAMSAHAFLDEIERGRRAGMNDYITKPIKREMITGILARFAVVDIKARAVKDNAPAGIASEDDLKEMALKYFMDNFGSTREDAGRFRQSSIAAVRETVEKIKKTITARDIDNAEKEFHKLKGILLNSGLQKSGDLASELNLMAREGKDLAGIEAGLSRLIEGLKAYYES